MAGAPSANLHVDPNVMSELRKAHVEVDGQRPRFGLFLFDCSDAATIRDTLKRVPESLSEWIAAVVVMLDLPDQVGSPESMQPRPDWPFSLRVHHPPRPSSFGAARKEAFESACREGLDHVIVMRADGRHPPERLPELVLEVLRRPRQLLLATRGGQKGASARSTSLHQLMTSAQNRLLGLNLHDYHTSFRVYPSDALSHVPYQLNADGTAFDAEIIIQFRTLGVLISEWPIEGGRCGDGSGNDSIRHGLQACRAAVDSRLHQIHITRDGRFLVDHDIHYTLKLSGTSSHMQIVSAIRPGSLVLDLGCSQGLLAEPLLEKNVRVVGVDAGPGRRLADALSEYHQRDLEEALEIPHQREFDYVICADVIEHLRNREQLLRSARRYLKEDGRLIISTGNVALWFYRLSLLVGRFEYGPRGVLDETHVHLFTGATFRREIERAGFRILKQRVTALPFEVVFQSTGRSRFVRRLAATYHALARLWPSMFAYQYVLEAEITTLDEESTQQEKESPSISTTG